MTTSVDGTLGLITTGNVTANNVFATNITGNITGNGSITAANITADQVDAGNLVTANYVESSSGTLFLGTLQLKEINPTTFGVFEADGTTQANIDVGTIDVSAITQGTSVIGIDAVNGNAYVTVAGANILEVTTNGITVDGNVEAGNLVTANYVEATSGTMLLGSLQLKEINPTTFGVFEADGVTQANIDVGTIDVSAITQGTSVIGIDAVNGNAYVTVAGANILEVNGNGVTVEGNVEISGDASVPTLLLTNADNNPQQTTIIARSARGTVATPAAVQSGDELFTIQAQGYTSFGQYQNAAGIQIIANADPVANSTSNLSSTIQLYSTNASGIVYNANLDSFGNLNLPGRLTTKVYSNAVNATTYRAARARGTDVANIATVQPLDSVLLITSVAYSGNGTLTADGITGWSLAGQIEVESAGLPSAPGFNTPSNVYIRSVGAANTINQFNFDTQGNLDIPGNTIYLGPNNIQLKAIDANTFGVFKADGVTQANIDIGNIDSSQITQGNSIIAFTGVGGNAYVQISAANVAEFTTEGLDVTGNVTVTGTITAGNLGAPGTSTDVLFNENGNISASNALQFNYASNALSIGGNLTVSGDATFLGNAVVSGNIQQISGNAGQFFGNLVTGTQALYAGIPLGYTVDPASVLQLAGNLDGYTQLESQNINPGPQASFDYVITADDGDNSNKYITMGLTSSTWDGTAPDSIGNAVGPRDGYMYVNQGNLVLGTQTTGKTVKILSGAFDDTGIVADFTSAGLDVTGNAIATGNVVGANIITAGKVIATGNIDGDNFAAAGNVVAVGNVIGANIKTVGKVIASGNVDGDNFNAAGNLAVAQNAVVTGNVTAGNVDASGKILAPQLESNIATGTAPLIVASITKVTNLNADLLDGYDSSIAAVADTVVIRDANANVDANSFTGTSFSISGNGIVGGNLLVAGNLVYTNVTELNVSDPIITLGRGPNNTPLTINDGLDRGTQMWYYDTAERSAFFGYDDSTGKLIAATSVTVTSDIVTVANYGNLVIGGLEAATGAFSGVTTFGDTINGTDVSVTGIVTATGNITGGNLITAGNAEVGGILTDNYYFANGAPFDFERPAGANRQVQYNDDGDFGASANFAFNSATNSLQVIGNIFSAFSQSNNALVVLDLDVGANLSVSGDITAVSDVSVAGSMIATGDVAGGNISTPGNIIASGNVGGDNYFASGNISATGNINGDNISAAGDVAVTGDVNGDNFFAAGNIDVSGNIDVLGFIDVSGDITATDTITGGNIVTAGNVSAANLVASANAYVDGILTDNYYYANGSPVDFEQPAGSNTQVQYNNNDNFGASSAFTFDEVANVLTIAGDIGANNVTITNDLSSNNLTVTSNAAVGNITTVALLATGSANVDSLIVVTTTDIGSTLTVADDITAGANIDLTGNLNITGNISQVTAQTARIFGDATTGIQALRAGVITGFANLATSVMQASTNSNDYTQVNQQNVNNGNQASADYVITANDGDDTNYFLDLGLTGSGWDGTQLNSLGNALAPRDGYLYVNQGNLVIGTDSAAKTVKIISGAPDATGIVATFNAPGTDSTGTGTGALVLTGGLGVSETITSDTVTTDTLNAGNATVSGNLAAGNLSSAGELAIVGNISGGNLITSGQVVATGNIVTSANVNGANLNLTGLAAIVGNVSAGNVNTTGVVVADGNITGGNLNTGGQVVATGNIVTSANVNGANLNLTGTADVVGNITGGNLVTGGQVVATGNIVTSANVNGANLNISGTADVVGNITGGNLVTGGQVVATGNIVSSANIDAANFNTSGNMSAGNISATTFTGDLVGNITLPVGANIQAAGANTQVLFNDGGNINAVSGLTFVKTSDTLTVTGNAIAANMYANSGTIGASLLTGTLTTVAQPNVTSLGTLNQLTVSNTTANIITLGPLQLKSINADTFGVFKSDGTTQANIDVGTVEVSAIIQGTSSIGIDAVNGNGYINVGGVGIFLANASGSYTTGIANATGNVNGANITTPGVMVATGNVTGGNITTAGQMVATGNVTGGNINTAGQVVATGNVSAGNAVIAANVVAGNLNSDVLTSRGLDLTLEATGTDKSILLVPTGLGTVDVSAAKITSLADPVNNQDAATKAYVDQFVQGILVKASVTVATTTGLPAYSYNNGTAGVGATITALANGVLTIDGQNTVLGDRILVKNETAGLVVVNGIYVVTTEGTAGAAYVLTRSLDMNTPNEVAGAFTFVQTGSTNADSGWVCTANQPVTIGTTAITWSQFSGAGSYTAGPGIALTGTTFSANVDGTTTAIIAGNIAVKNSAVLTTPNITDATGNSVTLTGGNGAFTGTTLTVTGNALAGNVYANSGTIGASLLTGTLTTVAQPNITSVGTLSSLVVSGNANVGNLNTIGQINAVGNINGGNLTTVGVMVATGNVSGGNITTSGIVSASGNVVSTANINGVNLNASGNVVVSTNANIAGIANVVGNVIAGNVNSNDKIVAVGNISTSGFYLGDGGFLSNVSVTAVTGIVNGSSNITIPTSAGNIKFFVAGAAAGNITPTSLAIGVGAGAAGLFTTAIGPGAGATGQGTQATALGYNAGATGQGSGAVAIGAFAGQTNQTPLSIAINATTNPLNTTGAGFFVKPVRSDSGNIGQVTFYNDTTGEFTYSTAIGISGNITAGNVYANAGTVGAATLAGTLSTAAQPSITSVGTLTSLAVTNGITAATVSATTLNGTLGTAAQPSITSVGTLSSLNVSGAITSGAAITGSTLAGTITTASQTNITSVGTLGSLNVSGGITSGGAISGSTLAGTITTASQTNITSVGTLGALAVTNGITAATVSATTLNGTLGTAAQPSITSVGTLTSLNVTGTTATGALNTTVLTAGSAGTGGTITGIWTLSGGSTLQATYSDLGERYSVDVPTDPGTVMMIGGSAEVTAATYAGRKALAGVISTDPAYVLNSTLKNSVIIALAGRVPCKVVGKINKGDILTVSHIDGVATATDNPEYGTIVGRALESYDSDTVGVIEIKVDRG